MKYLLITTLLLSILVGHSFGNAVAEVEFNEVVPSHEVAVSDLPQLLSSEEGIKQLYEEFASIKGGKRRSWTVAELPENIVKNRYSDLLAFDPSRVVLNQLPGDPFSDYINANYIDGQNFEREYVATQGPLPNTVNDFWRMIWQLNATKIIMLANVIEHDEKKVEKYWPDANARYGNIEVTKIAEYSIRPLKHIVRFFSIKELDSKPRIVRQFHFTGWPDLGVPEDTVPVISIIHQARVYDPESTAPLVVHCSAGIGRTGTIILMDSMMQRAAAEGVVDFPKRLDHMRTLRPDLVEKKEQYVFAYQAVSDVANDPLTKLRLLEVEAEYRRLDSLYAQGFALGSQGFVLGSQGLALGSQGLALGLQGNFTNRIMWQSNLLAMLIKDLMEQSKLYKERNSKGSEASAKTVGIKFSIGARKPILPVIKKQ